MDQDFNPASLQTAQQYQQQADQNMSQMPQAPEQQPFDPSKLQEALSQQQATTSGQPQAAAVSPLPPQINQQPSTPPSPQTSPVAGAVPNSKGLLDIPRDLFGLATKGVDTSPVENANNQVDQQSNQGINTALQKQGFTTASDLSQDKPSDEARAAIGLGDTFTAKYNTFKKFYPDGDMREVNDGGTNTLVYTPDANNKSLPWARLTPTFQEGVNAYLQIQKDPSTNPAQKTAASMLLIGRAIEDNSGEAATTAIMTLLTGGGGLWRQGAKLVAAGEGSKLATHDALEASGVSTGESSPQVLAKGTIEGLEAFASLGVIKAGAGVLNAGRAVLKGVASGLSGSGMFEISPAAKEARDALDRLKNIALLHGVDPKTIDAIGYMPNQLVSLPLLERWSKQAQSILGKIGNYLEVQKTFLSDTVKRMLSPEDLQKAVSRGQQADTLARGAAIDTGPANPNVSFKKAGDVYAGDLGGYADRSQAKVRELYAARDATLKPGEAPQYDPKPALDAVAQAEKGTPQPYTEAPTPSKTLVDAEGKPLMMPGKEQVNQIEPLTPEAQNIADKIKLWQSSPPKPFTNKDGTVTTVADQIQAMQRQLYDLSRPDASGAMRLDPTKATMMRSGLQTMLENPTNGNPAFQAANEAAKAAARERFTNLDDPLVRRGNRQDLESILTTPESSVQTMGATSGRQVSQLDRLKSIMLPENYETVLQSYRTNLLNNMDKLSDTMDRMDPELRSRIFPDDKTAQAYKDLGTTWKQINEAEIGSTAEANRNANPEYTKQAGAKYIDQLLQDKDVTNLQTIENIVQANPETQFAQSIRAGLMQHIAMQSLGTFRGATSVSAPALTETLNKYDYKTLSRFLTPEDKSLLQDINTTAQQIERTGGTGDALVGAQKASEIMSLKKEVLQTLVEHWWIGSRWTRPGVQEFFYGKAGVDKTPLQQVLSKAVEGLSGKIPSDLPIALQRALVALNPTETMTTGHSTYTSAQQQTNEALKQQGAK
jgi:hypothetical protein